MTIVVNGFPLVAEIEAQKQNLLLMLNRITNVEYRK